MERRAFQEERTECVRLSDRIGFYFPKEAKGNVNEPER